MNFLIVDLLNAIYTNGNAKFYFRNTNGKTVALIHFDVDQNGKLSIRSKMEKYDKCFSDGKNINQDANLLSSWDVTDTDYAENKLDYIIAVMLDWNLLLQNFTGSTFITSQQRDIKINTDAASKKVFDMAISMLDPNPEVLEKMAREYGKIDAYGISNMFLNNRKEERVLESNPSEYTQILEKEVSKFLEALNLAKEEYNRMQREGFHSGPMNK